MRKCVPYLGSLYNAARLDIGAHSLQHQCRRHASTYQRRVAVLGGGITGLAAAYFIRRESPHASVTLFESQESLGGWLRSTRIPVADGSVLFEAGPRSLRPANNGVLAARLVNELGMKDQVIITPRTSAAARNRYLYYPDHLVRMPHPAFGILDFLSSAWKEPIFKGWFSALIRDIRVGPRDDHIKDESISEFFSRRLGPGLVDNIISGVIHGIYAGDVDRLSARSIFPRQWHDDSTGLGLLAGGLQLNPQGTLMRASEVSFLKDMHAYDKQWDPELRADLAQSSVFTFKEGMGALTDALATRLWADAGVEVRTSTEVNGAEFMKDQNTVRLQVGKENELEVFDRVVSTLSPTHLERLCHKVSTPFPHIPGVNVMTVNLFYNTQEKLPPGPRPDQLGFGYLIPRSVPFEQNPERALGVVFDHAYAPLEVKSQDGEAEPSNSSFITQDDLPNGGTKVTVMLGGHWWDDWPAFPDEQEGLAMAKSVLARHLGIMSEPELWRVNMQRDCIPQYTVGHEDRLQQIHKILQQSFDGKLRVAGNWISGVGVNDCLRSAWDTSLSLLDNKDNTGLEKIGTEKWVYVSSAPIK